MDYIIQGSHTKSGSAEFQHFSGRSYSPHEKVYNFSKIIIKQVIYVKDWGISTMKERMISLNNTRMNFAYWDYIQAFVKVLYYNNDKHKHTWFIKVCTSYFQSKLQIEKIDQIYFFIEFSILWIHKWTPEVGFTEENIPCLYRTYYNNFWNKLMKQDPKTKQLIGIIDDNSVRHIAKRISFQEGDKESMINDYLEEIDKSDTSMRSETSNDDMQRSHSRLKQTIYCLPPNYKMQKNSCKNEGHG
ncbi:hypothetical protein H5410_030574 [Solanum commersonii]|uniref:Uncharacterized protein n=1 Tax=Solanum commersonii TaxID=4109 RepID=A0A9J5YJ34_SOLCO|nr:hypothetical protein H5410_030574 [Solanum commersonii]